MYFTTLADALHMAGHGRYVWVSYAATLLVMFVLIWWPIKQRRQLIEQQQRIKRINASSQGDSSLKDQED